MKNGIRIASTIALFLNALLTPALSQNLPLSFKGQWRLDLNRTFTPWGPIPKSVTITVTTDDGKDFDAEETWDRNGAVITAIIHTPIDGKFYPVLGVPGNMNAAITRWASGFIRVEFLESGLHGVETCKLSTDSKIMTCDEVDTDLKGKSSLSQSVYTRSE